jgi:hypothetical protein
VECAESTSLLLQSKSDREERIDYLRRRRRRLKKEDEKS